MTARFRNSPRSAHGTRQRRVYYKKVPRLEPDPKSRMGASRFIGRSKSAGRLLVVIAVRDFDGDLHGITAWPATGADRRFYEEGLTDDQDD